MYFARASVLFRADEVPRLSTQAGPTPWGNCVLRLPSGQNVLSIPRICDVRAVPTRPFVRFALLETLALGLDRQPRHVGPQVPATDTVAQGGV